MRKFSVGNPTLFASLESTPSRARWPVPALLAWSLCWALYLTGASMAVPAWVAGGAATALGVCLGMFGRTRVRAVVMAGGFPLSWLANLAGDTIADAAGALPAWAWLLPLAMLLLLYPHRAWRDAPLFPTPSGALDVLSVKVRLPSPARVLDAGCGLGHGLQALHRAFPQARIEGIEWSWPLAWLARLRCRRAR